ncbi:MAG: glutamine amidotransferase [Candidatus Saccharibacteria bacterium]|nr:glutamine amidotransferase [Candidatus Saccharibacteria bacterium]
MSKQNLHIVHLYPKEMNIYGDTGNTLILRRRAEWRDIDVRVSLVGIGDEVPHDADIILGGGGQDAGQDKVQADLQEKADALHKLAFDGTVMLMICGMYQLFGRAFKTGSGNVIKGISILPLETTAGLERFIGNTVYQTEFGETVAYENHSGVTSLDDKSLALGRVVQGAGNNGLDKTEGCRIKNVFGTYSHGPLLSKNPVLADLLLEIALKRKYGESAMLALLDDSLEQEAYKFAKQRPR